MLNTELRKEIDNSWEACWPVNNLKPLVLIDCICYLLFLKKLQDSKLIAGSFGEQGDGNVCYQNNSEELYWSYIKSLDSKSLHELFNKDNGIDDLLKGYGHTNLPYSNFLKAPLLIHPSGVLLVNIVKIIEIIESADNLSKGAIFDYLLHKEEIHTTLGQVYLPADMISAIISLVKPAREEIICDPVCGNGDFLVSAASYISLKSQGKNSYQPSKKIMGFDSDAVQLRIAAMNMILHGIEEPSLFGYDTKEPTYIFPEKPAVIISNLFFASVANNNVTDTSPLTPETSRKDTTLLKSILTHLKKGSRAAVIVRSYMLNNNLLPEVIAIRRQLIDNYKIDAIINLPDKTGAVSSDASILIFHLPDEKENNDKIWFYKMKQAVNIFEDAEINLPETAGNAFINEDVALADVQIRPKTATRKTEKITLTENFYVSAEEIKNNFCNLGYNQYKKNTSLPTTVPINNNISPQTAAPPPLVKTQRLLDVSAKLNAAAFAFNKTAWSLLVKTKSFFVVTGKWIAKSFNTTASQLVVKAQELFTNKSKLNTKSFILNKTTSQLLAKTKRDLNGSSKLNGKAVTLHTTASQLLVKTQLFFNVTGKWIAKTFASNKKGSIILLSVIISGCSLIGFLLVHKTSGNDNSSVPLAAYTVAAKTGKPEGTIKQTTKLRIKKKLTQQQIDALINDTSEIIHFENMPVTNDVSTDDSPKAIAIKNDNVKIAVSQKKQSALQSPKAGIGKIQYMVTDTTYFHDKPDEKTARKSYLDPLRKAVLTALQDSNGYIYIVYTNKINITSKGWIDKRALRQVP